MQIDVSLEVSALTHDWNEGDLEAVQNAIAQKLSKSKEFEPWHLVTVSDAAAGAAQWAVVLTIRAVNIEELRFQEHERGRQARKAVIAKLEVLKNERLEGELQAKENLWGPGDFRFEITTPADQAPERLSSQIATHFLSLQREDVRSLLRPIPVGYGAVCRSITSSPRPFLELPIEATSEEVCSAQFEIHYDLQYAGGYIRADGNEKVENPPTPLLTIPCALVLPGADFLPIAGRTVETHLGELDICEIEKGGVFFVDPDSEAPPGCRSEARRAEVHR